MQPSPSVSVAPSAEETIKARSAEALAALRDENYAKLEQLAHSDGVTFSPYAAIQPDRAVTLTVQGAGRLKEDKEKRVWGEADGTGDPIELAWPEYRKRFVFDRDYTKAEQTSYNKRIGQGNSLDNARDTYPGSNVTEYYFAGTEKNSTMDWSALRLVWLEEGGEWKLRAIVHDGWTI